MKKVREKFLSLFMVFAMLFTSFSTFIPMTVHAATTNITKIEYNYTASVPFTDEATGNSVKSGINHSVPSGANYSAPTNNKWIKQCPTSAICTPSQASYVTDDLLVAGNYTYLVLQAYAEPYQVDYPNPEYDFDKNNLDNIEIWVNGTRRTDAIVSNYNSSWRSVTVNIPVTVTDGSATTPHTVTFYDGSTFTTETVNHGENVSKPSNPTYGTLDFVHWKLSGAQNDNAYNFNTPVTGDITLEAVWNFTTTATAYPSGTGKIKRGGSTGTYQENLSYTRYWLPSYSGRLLDEYVPMAETGYKFKEWRIGSPTGQVVGTDSSAGIYYLASNKALEIRGKTDYACKDFYAIFEAETPIQHTVTYDFNGGTPGSISSSFQVNDGEKLDFDYLKYQISNFVTPPTGKEFYNFAIDGNAWNSGEYTVTKPITLKVQWDFIPSTPKHAITFDLNGGTSSISVSPVNEGEKIKFDTFKKIVELNVTPPTNKELDAFEIGGTRWDNGEYTVTAPITLKILWKDKSPTQHTVKFFYKDSFFGDTEFTELQQQINAGEKATEPSTAPVIVNHRFDGWYSDATCSTPFNFNTPITTNTIIYGKYIEEVVLNYDVNGGTNISLGNSLGNDFVDKGTVINRTDYENKFKDASKVTPPTGKELDYLEINGTKWTANTYTADSYTTTIKAVWKDIVITPTYTIETGDGQSFTLGETNDIVIKASGNLAKLTEIKVDGTTLVSSNYTTASGSTVLTLLNSYLNTLSVGNHTVTFVYDDGSVDATLKVLAAQNTSDDDTNTTGDNTNTNTNTETNNNNTTNDSSTGSPQTGDNIVNYIITLIISIIGLAGGSLYLNRKKIFANK